MKNSDIGNKTANINIRKTTVYPNKKVVLLSITLTL